MSSPGANYGWLEIVLSAVVALGFGGYQLWSVNREIRRDRERAQDPPDRSE
ncbi:hypothetical protein [Pseudomonas aeruginosa]|uniref:hypothetical protein n=1 Tax=Pseudomonas aeruginosa TaxID=287 RepID=UPI00397DDB4C